MNTNTNELTDERFKSRNIIIKQRDSILCTLCFCPSEVVMSKKLFMSGHNITMSIVETNPKHLIDAQYYSGEHPHC